MLNLQWATDTGSLPPLDLCFHLAGQALMTVTQALAEGTRVNCFDKAKSPLLPASTKALAGTLPTGS
jgi:hypothetical protein